MCKPYKMGWENRWKNKVFNNLKEGLKEIYEERNNYKKGEDKE